MVVRPELFSPIHITGTEMIEANDPLENPDDATRRPSVDSYLYCYRKHGKVSFVMGFGCVVVAAKAIHPLDSVCVFVSCAKTGRGKRKATDDRTCSN